MDSRGERTRQQVCSQETWNEIWSRLDKIEECKTLHVMVGVPIAFPAMPKAKEIVSCIEGHKFAAKLTKLILGENRDGSPEPPDDCYYDHWDAHKEERDELIRRLQEFAKRTGAKVVLLSGDVHSASTGEITGENRPTIYQITSSAVGSLGPSRAAVAALEKLDHLEESTTSNGDKIRLVESLSGPDGKKETFVRKRNCCVISGDSVIIYDEDGKEHTSNILTGAKTDAQKCCAVA